MQLLEEKNNVFIEKIFNMLPTQNLTFKIRLLQTLLQKTYF